MGRIIVKMPRYFILLILLTGCLPKWQPTADSPSLLPMGKTEGAATLSVFLQTRESGGPPIWLRINNLKVKTGDKWLPIAMARNELRSLELEQTGQFFVGRGGMPAGDYDRVGFTLEKAALEKDGQKIFLSLPEENEVEISLDQTLSLKEGDSISLFLNWDTKNSLKGKTTLTPLIEAELQSIPLTSDLAYISCPEINTIYIIRTDNNRVCGSIGISGNPTVIEIKPELNRFYVLSPEDPSVRILELTSNRQLDQVRIPFSREPVDMTVGPAGEWAFILDNNTNRLFRLDLFNGSLAGRISLTEWPRYILNSEERGLLLISSAYGQEVSFIDPVDFTVVEKINVGGTPEGLLIFENNLYIAENSTDTVVIYDLNANIVTGQIQVGRKPRRIVENNHHIYVSNYAGRSISVLLPGQLNVSSEIQVDGMPFEMAVSSVRQWLYAGDAQKGGVYLVDLSSNQMVKKIELGAIPYDLEVVEP